MDMASEFSLADRALLGALFPFVGNYAAHQTVLGRVMI